MEIMRNNLVAIVDNDAEFINKIMNTLTTAGFEVIVVNSGLELLSVLSIDRPVAILISTMLPWIDSIEVLRAMKGNPNFREIKVFLVSNQEWMRENRIEKRDADLLSGVFYKHLDKSIFVAKLKEEVEKSGSH